MGKKLVIVESPTKARTIRRFLPSEYEVVACVGHVRDLPQNSSEVPKEYREFPWAKSLGIDVENGFKPLYVVPKGKQKVLREIKSVLKGAESLILATDEDREGESISWHLAELLKPRVPVYRMVFHEITKSAIAEALTNFREIDAKLVEAQETRRLLDRLVGYPLSDVVWKKIAYGLSAGRVQSPGLRMITERELVRCTYEPTVYWDLVADLTSEQGAPFQARLTSYKGTQLVSSADFDAATGARSSAPRLVLTEKEAQDVVRALSGCAWVVAQVSEKELSQKPPLPYITSSLQQDGVNKLGTTSREVMRIAQSLYQSGKITYMRTDSPTLSQQALSASRRAVSEIFGDTFLTEKPRNFRGGKGEAHEAIRPAGATFTRPEQSGLSGRDLALYRMIWQRTLASQMLPAKKKSVKVSVKAEEAIFDATGTRIVFPGFLSVYGYGVQSDSEQTLPALKEGDTCQLKELHEQKHVTRPPARYTEASLIKELERRGIGRPSTYATIISRLYDKQYIRRERSALVPTFTGMVVAQLLERHFNTLVDYTFTSRLEERLDQIAHGNLHGTSYLSDFFLGADGLREQIARKLASIDPDESRTLVLPQIKEGCQIRVGKFGPYLVWHDEENQEIHASIPEDVAPADVEEEGLLALARARRDGPEPLGHHPDTNQPVYLLTGRYGPYLQLGEAQDDEKPKRASLPSGTKIADVGMELALNLLSLPKELGLHPESQQPISVHSGRYGHYLKCGDDTRSLKKEDDPFTITAERAIALLAEPRAAPRKRVAKPLREFDTGGKGAKIMLFSGRYGPYLKRGSKNFRIPDEFRGEKELQELTVEQAVQIVKNS